MWLHLVRPLLGTRHATQACALTGNRTGDPLVLRPVLSPLSHTNQAPNSISSYIFVFKNFVRGDMEYKIVSVPDLFIIFLTEFFVGLFCDRSIKARFKNIIKFPLSEKVRIVDEVSG